MTIYIANTTRQEYELHCRMPEMNRIFVQRISSGRQVDVKGLSPGQEEALIRHMQKYGGASRADLHGKIKGFQGLAFDTSKPFKMDEFHYGLEEVIDAAESRSVVEATRSALAAAEAVRDKVTGQLMPQSVEMEIIEEHPEKGSKRKRNAKITIDPKVENGDVLPIH